MITRVDMLGNVDKKHEEVSLYCYLRKRERCCVVIGYSSGQDGVS